MENYGIKRQGSFIFFVQAFGSHIEPLLFQDDVCDTRYLTWEHALMNLTRNMHLLITRQELDFRINFGSICMPLFTARFMWHFGVYRRFKVLESLYIDIYKNNSATKYILLLSALEFLYTTVTLLTPMQELSKYFIWP